MPHSRAAGLVTKSVLPASASDSIPTPGATRSGLALKSIALGPRELNAATVSSRRSAVPMWLEAPTVSTHGALPGAPIPPYWTLAVRFSAEIARGRHDDDPRLDGALRRERERIGR